MNSNIDLQRLKNHYQVVGTAPTLLEALETAIKVAPTDLSVLIQGESGVGKEIIPRIIHDMSARKNNTYIAINCGSIPEGTIDSELFGHEKGSFTNAIGEHEGYFGVANGGTLFLDEVGELPMSTQARLLRVLETGEYLRVGSNTPKKTNARIVAATNVDIPNAIREGRFREDLYYRLCTINIKVPPLRERGSDVVLLFKKFALDTAEKYRIPTPLRLTPEAEDVIKRYKWPGNIRQLRNITEQMSILSEERSITPDTLAKYGIVPNSNEETGIITTSRFGKSTTHDYEQEIKMLAHAVLELKKEVNILKEKIDGHATHGSGQEANFPAVPSVELTQAVETAASPLPTHWQTRPAPTFVDAQPQDIPTAEEVTDSDTLNISDMERRNIIKALERNHYKRKFAAEELGISERTLYRKIKAYGIDE